MHHKRRRPKSTMLVIQLGEGGFIEPDENAARTMQARQVFVKRYCEERGWDIKVISIPQILEIRKQPGWINPVIASEPS